MCGIAGIVSPDRALRSFASSMGRSIAHRGPEDEGVWNTLSEQLSVTFVHRRLRVIDLSGGGRQPMVRGSYTLVFNGEIYNFLELRRVLEEQGLTFNSNSDTEVILAAYSCWGIRAIERLHGMFAFALWDGDRRELILARDRLGKKPLFYREGDCSFVFGSEIKAILATLEGTPKVDKQALDDYLTYLYIPYPRTIFEGIRQLPPASYLRMRYADGRFQSEISEYWTPIGAEHNPSGSIDDLRSRLQDLVAESVRSRLISDVPLGVLLSGGLDSSSITAMVARSSTEPARTFSIGFPQNKNYDEIPYANLVADHFGCRHEVLQAEPSCSRFLVDIVRHFDQPFGNPTAVLTYILSALTKKSVTVALAGDGGDELFGGYPRYIGAYMSRIPRALPGFVRNRILPWLGNSLSDDSTGRHQVRRLREFLEDAGLPLIEMYLRWIGYFSDRDKASLYAPEMRASVKGHDSGDFLRGLFARSEGLEPLNRLAYVDTKSFLCCNVLEYADRMSMAHALELRAPFTDHRLVEFALQLPFNLKFRNGESKWLLRSAMKPFVPEPILNKRKLGFNPPLGRWLSGELKTLPGVLLSPQRIARRGLFDAAAIANLLDRHNSGRRDHSLHIWSLMMLELWFCLYIDGQPAESLQEEIDGAVSGPRRRVAVLQ
jgi:asparagine synthase (glutamine-hydrolysing)